MHTRRPKQDADPRRTIRLVTLVSPAEAEELRLLAWQRRTPLSALIRSMLLRLARRETSSAV